MRGRDTRVFNMGCGPAQEIQRFFAESELSNYTHFTLTDFNEETLTNTCRLLEGLKKQHFRRGNAHHGEEKRPAVAQIPLAANMRVRISMIWFIAPAFLITCRIRFAGN